MTLAIGVYAQGAIVMAADGRVTSQTSLGNALHTDKQRKIYGFGRFGIATAGFTGLAEDFLLALGLDHALESCADVAAAEAVVSDVIRTHMKRFVGCPEDFWPRGSLMLVGYEADRSTPRIHCLHSQMSYQRGVTNWVGTERGGTVANALAMLCLDGWEIAPTVEQAKVFAAMAIQLASEIDKDVGTLRGIATVTPDRGFEDISDEVPCIQRRSREAVDRIRQSLTGVHQKTAERRE